MLQSEYSLTVGKEYPVLGIGLFESTLSVLIMDDDGLPNWVPAGLFDIPPQPVPIGWEFALREGIYASGKDAWAKTAAICGYQELVQDPSHGSGMMEREESDLALFRQRAREAKEKALGA